jgi:hypothetical protein
MSKTTKINKAYLYFLVSAGIATSLLYIFLINMATLANSSIYALSYIPLVLFAPIYGYGLYKLGGKKGKEYTKASIAISFFMLFSFIYAYLNSGFYL